MELSHANLCVDTYTNIQYAVILKFSMQYVFILELLLQSQLPIIFSYKLVPSSKV